MFYIEMVVFYSEYLCAPFCAKNYSLSSIESVLSVCLCCVQPVT